MLSAVGAFSWALSPGAYRCVSFNAGGAGGRCPSAPPIEIRADGSYTESSTTGRYTLKDGQIVFSESRIRGPGQLIGDNAFRFQYSYNGLAHTSTYQCFRCTGAVASSEPASGGAATQVGVTLLIEFSESVAGATGFVIVPRESASRFKHYAALPAGAVSGLVVDVSQSLLRLETNRNNRLVVNRPYVVFLVYPAETVAVAAFHLPSTKTDYEGRLTGGIYRGGLPQASSVAPPPANDPPPSAVGGGFPAGPTAYPAPPGSPMQGSPAPDASADPAQALEGFARTLKNIGDLFNALGQQGQALPVGASGPSSDPAPVPGSYTTPSAYPTAPTEPSSSYPPPSAYPDPLAGAPGGYPPSAPTTSAPPPKCHPNIPKYSQPDCVE
ncbi:MAG: hypothetical protein A3F78_11240 [Burkholderiales bacterium RIFCSPLOWO2_12_FULL_61_40]|nr:MAG: hypothetical protein A3F78_11240 [Burkholderiales bacterium RIFCSPLOWO2_12_FULL_61_40]